MAGQTNKRLRILINANAIWSSSGYATQTEQITRKLKEYGYPVACVNFYGQEGGIVDINGVRQYPKMGDAWGSDAMIHHGNDWKADVTFTLQDSWTLDMNNMRFVRRWIPILPIDHDPPNPNIMERMWLPYRIVSYSKFGHDRLKKYGYYSTYIPHTVDTQILKPLNNKMEMRKKYGLPTDVFLFGMVAANKDNPPRKSFQEVLDAFAEFKKTHPKSAIYFHTFVEQQGGFPIKLYAKVLEIEKDIYHLPPYDQMFHCGRQQMAELYNAMDCLLNPSNNEGFGVPIIEAQACGVPAIVTNFSAMPELIIPDKTGWLVDVAYKRFDGLQSFCGVPSVTSIHNSMVEAYKMDKDKVSEMCRKNALDYDLDKVWNEKWLPFLDLLEKEVYPNN